MVVLAALILVGAPLQIDGVKAYSYADPWMPGQREIAQGMLPGYGFMSIYYQKETDARFLPTQVIGNGMIDKNLGYVRWSVKSDTIFGKPCFVLRMEGQYNQRLPYSRYRPSDNVIIAKSTTKEEYWVDLNYKIIRHYVEATHPNGTTRADSAYSADHIETRLTDSRGKTTFGTVFPADMESIQRMFQPMIKDGQVLQQEKKYTIYDPIKQTFLERTARVQTRFAGKYGGDPVAGEAVEIDDGVLPILAYITDDGDLFKVDLKNDRLMLNTDAPVHKGKSGG